MKKDGRIIKEYGDVNVYGEEVASFVDLVRGKKSIIATVRDGGIVVKIVNAANRSDATGCAVKIDD